MKDIYTPPDAAIEILEERRQDKNIRDKVAEYLGGQLPSDCMELEKPTAILARYVARATNEDKVFAEQAITAGFNPVWGTYFSDRFTTRNPEKVATIRPSLLWSKGQKTRSWVVEAACREGGIGELPTIYGISSAEFQRNIRSIVLPKEGYGQLAANEFDMGAWYAYQTERLSGGASARAAIYYQAAMALYTTFGVLFEDFDGGPNSKKGELAGFKSEVVIPAFKKVEQDLCLRPVIVRLPYQDGMGDTDMSFLDVNQQQRFLKYGTLSELSDVEGIS